VNWSALKPRDKNVLRYLALLVVLGLLLMSVRSLGGTAAPRTATTAAAGGGDVAAEEAALAADLAQVLGQVAGAGRVQVRVALAGSEQRVYATNDTTQSTASGQGSGQATTQTQTSHQVVTVGDGAVPVQALAPSVQGVLVVATGAGDPGVRAALAEAAAAALGVPIYRVTVLVGGEGTDHGR
jgi:stage III sporulation protein AG